jgi:hypothetical protein
MPLRYASEVPRPAPHVVFKRVGDELVLLDYDRGVYYGLDAAGARMWELLAAELDEDAVVAQLLTEFEVDEATLRRDMTALSAELLRLKLLL